MGIDNLVANRRKIVALQAAVTVWLTFPVESFDSRARGFDPALTALDITLSTSSGESLLLRIVWSQGGVGGSLTVCIDCKTVSPFV